jgi:hypothetical protein
MARQTKLITSTLFLILTILAMSANAQNARVYVATSGSDANPCTAPSPCQTITKALSVVDTGGEVVISENGDYDKFVISKSVTVGAAPGISAGIVSNGGYAILMPNTMTSSDSVGLRNLNVKSTANPAASDGIANIGAGALYVDGCTITGMTYAVTMTANGQLFMHDTTIRNSNFALFLNGPLTEGSAKGVVDHCRIEQNDYGLYIGSKVTIAVRDTILTGNTSAGVRIASIRSGSLTDVTVDNCQFSNNGGGLTTFTNNGGVIIARLEHSTFVKNITGVGVFANTTIYSLQNNLIDGNGTNINGALTPLAAK